MSCCKNSSANSSSSCHENILTSHPEKGLCWPPNSQCSQSTPCSPRTFILSPASAIPIWRGPYAGLFEALPFSALFQRDSLLLVLFSLLNRCNSRSCCGFMLLCHI